MTKLIGIIQPMETTEVRAEGAEYEDAKEALVAQVPEGWRLISIRTDR